MRLEVVIINSDCRVKEIKVNKRRCLSGKYSTLVPVVKMTLRKPVP